MSENASLEPITIQLSRDELLLVLSLLEADSLPGLDREPQGERTDEQQTLALTVAARGLRARDLAQLRNNRSLVLHQSLLTAVGVCAYAQNTLFLYHWPAGAVAPLRYFGHVRGDEAVIHSRPATVLHRFTLLPTKTDVAAQMVSACQLATDTPDAGQQFTLSPDRFVAVREQTNDGETETAVATLTAADVPADSARAFVAALAAPTSTAIMQSLQQQADSVIKRDFTLIQGENALWQVAPTAVAAEAPLAVQTTTAGTVQTMLAGWL